MATGKVKMFPAYAVESTSSYILSSSAVSFRYRPLHIVFGGVNCIGRKCLIQRKDLVLSSRMVALPRY